MKDQEAQIGRFFFNDGLLWHTVEPDKFLGNSVKNMMVGGLTLSVDPICIQVW